MSEARNAKCPACGSRALDREDVIEQTVFRRIEVIADVGGIYGLRAISSQPDRKGGTGRGGVAIRCADCGWHKEAPAGDRHQSPEYQELLRTLLDGEQRTGDD